MPQRQAIADLVGEAASVELKEQNHEAVDFIGQKRIYLTLGHAQ